MSLMHYGDCPECRATVQVMPTTTASDEPVRYLARRHPAVGDVGAGSCRGTHTQVSIATLRESLSNDA